MIRPLRSASYQPVEDSEFEVLEHEGFDSRSDAMRGPPSDRNVLSGAAANPHPASSPSDNGAPMVRTVSSEGSLPLSHPTPDLQSLQGAYVGNVERLEQSAERLSLRSDLGEEIRKLRLEQRLSESRRSSIRQPPSRHYSTNSLSNSIRSVNRVARSGGFSPEAYVASPIGSMMSPPWSQRSVPEQLAASATDAYSQRSEPEKEGLPLDSPISLKPIPLTVRNSNPTDLEDETREEMGEHGDDRGSRLGVPERTASAASGDTYQRANKEFESFDGVHIESGQRDSVGNDGGAREAVASPAPAPGPGMRASMPPQLPPQPPPENLVFYPAPVPMMLNLPKRLSRAPPAHKIAQKKQDVLQSAMADNRKSAPVLSPDHVEAGSTHPSESSKRASELPPQLRATMFFDHKHVKDRDIQVKHGSAVDTLDSILDASAHAPVSAFTDHPIVGHLGNEVYGSALNAGRAKGTKANRRSRSSVQLLNERKTTSPLLDRPDRGISVVMEEGGRVQHKEQRSPQGGMEDGDNATESTPLRGSLDGGAREEEAEEEEEDEEEEEEEQEEEPETLTGRPTTLLAELQMRKAQQKLRTRTAANAFPNGMHSTLLQLDAVAQVQKTARKQKHVTLAWEDADASHPQDGTADDDVPLGVLYPGKAAQRLNDPTNAPWDEDRPLGLLAQKAMEEHEPLSRRRARLLGGNAAARHFDETKRASTMDLTMASPLAQSVPAGDGDEDDGREGETLAQRRQRLRNEKRVDEPRPVSGDFASELLSQLGAPAEKSEGVNGTATPSKTPDPEETLGQRRKRLLAEKEAQSRQASGGSAGPAPGQPAAVGRVRSSMADLLQSNPVGARDQAGGIRRVGSGLGDLLQTNSVSPLAQAGHQAPVNGIHPKGLVSDIDPARTHLHTAPSYSDTPPSWGATAAYHGGALGYDATNGYGANGYTRGVLPTMPNATASGPGYGLAPHASYVNPMSYTPMMGLHHSANGAAGGALALPEMAPVQDHMLLNEKQRAMIDRWRQGVH